MHAKSSGTRVQEFLAAPAEDSFKAALEEQKAFYARVKKATRANKIDLEGGLVTRLNEEKTLDVLSKQGEHLDCGFPMGLGLDLAGYQKFASIEKQAEWLESLVEKHNLFYLEDPFDQDDFASFADLRLAVRKYGVFVCGDDLTVTSRERVKKAARQKSINAVIIKPNQAGTLSRTIEAIREAQRNRIVCVPSHRSGETSSHFIADLAIAFGCPFVKVSFVGRERVAKTSWLEKIEKIKKFKVNPLAEEMIMRW